MTSTGKRHEAKTFARWRTVASLVVAGGLAWAASTARAQEPEAASLVYAVYDNEGGAMNAFKAMQQAQKQQVIEMESYAVVSKDAKGKVHVQRSNQKTGTIAGSVVGGLIGAIGGPAGSAAGGLMGRAAGEATGIPTEDIKAIKDTLQPGSSALIAVVDERWVSDVSRSLHQTDARRVLDTKIQQGTIGSQPSGSQPNTPPPSQQP